MFYEVKATWEKN